MHDDTDRFVLPDLPDEAVVALERLIEDFYSAFQNRYFSQIHRCYHAQRPDDDQLPLPLDPSF